MEIEEIIIGLQNIINRGILHDDELKIIEETIENIRELKIISKYFDSLVEFVSEHY